MFNTKKELEALKDKYDRLQEKCEKYQAQNEALQERLDKISNGEPCEGGYCKSCKHYIPSECFKYVSMRGELVCFGGSGKPICTLHVPCPDFERNE